jgi:hypothetical protein
MNIYKIEQDIVNDYDTYDAAIVVAESEDDARTIHPGASAVGKDGRLWVSELWEQSGVWVYFKDIDKIRVTLIGVADPSQERGVILSSFNAG